MAEGDVVIPNADQLRELQALSAQTGISVDTLIGKVNDLLASSGKGADGFSAAFNKIKAVSVDVAKVAGDALHSLTDGLSNFVRDLGNTESIEKAKIGFVALSSSIFKASNSFTNLRGMGADNVLTIMPQITQLENSFNQGGAAALLAEKGIRSMASGLGFVGNAATAGAGTLLNFIKNTAAMADNTTRMEYGLFSAAGATGELGNSFAKAGVGLQNMGAIINAHREAMVSTISSTGYTAEAVENWYMQLAHVPGALKQVVSASDDSGGRISMLTAVTKMAAGNFRDTKDVISDLGTVFTNLGMEGEPALNFINNFSEMSSKLGVEFGEMKKGLLGAADAFKNLTTVGAGTSSMTDGLKQMMNEYVYSLKESGMTGTHAIETVNNMATAMGKLTMAQKMYLSSKTGGPGGIGGALQIEKMVRTGDVEGLQKKLLDTVKKQLGPIISFDEAEQAGGATARKFQLQRQKIMEGPLGGALGVKNEEDASRMLDALKLIEKGIKPPPELTKGNDALKKYIDNGTAVQRESNTPLNAINANISKIMGYTGDIAKELQTRALGANAATNISSGAEHAARMRDSAIAGGKGAANYAGDIGSGGHLRDNRPALYKAAAEKVAGMISSLSEGATKMLGSVFSAQKGLETGGEGAKKSMQELIAKKRDELNRVIGNKETAEPVKADARQALQAVNTISTGLKSIEAPKQINTIFEFPRVGALQPVKPLTREAATAAASAKPTALPSVGLAAAVAAGAALPQAVTVNHPDGLIVNVTVTEVGSKRGQNAGPPL